MTPKQQATHSCRRTLRRREAGEHTYTVSECVVMWATEWRLAGAALNDFFHEMQQYAEELSRAHDLEARVE